MEPSLEHQHLITLALQKDLSTDRAWGLSFTFMRHRKVRKICQDYRVDATVKIEKIYKLLTPYLRRAGVSKYHGIPRDPIVSLEQPSLEKQLEAVRKDGWWIEKISAPCLVVQMAAIEQDPNAIAAILRPDPRVQLAAVRKCPMALKMIRRPTPEAQIEAIKLNHEAFLYLKHPCKEARNQYYQQRRSYANE